LFLAGLGLALVLTGCGSGAGESYWTRDQFDSGTGAVTITGIPGSHQGKYAMIAVQTQSSKILMGGAYPPGECARISGASMIFPIRDITHLGQNPADEDFFGTLPPAYTGTENGTVVIFFFNDSKGYSDFDQLGGTFTFTDGNARIAWGNLARR
jgi:hypothetical protein